MALDKSCGNSPANRTGVTMRRHGRLRASKPPSRKAPTSRPSGCRCATGCTTVFKASAANMLVVRSGCCAHQLLTASITTLVTGFDLRPTCQAPVNPSAHWFFAPPCGAEMSRMAWCKRSRDSASRSAGINCAALITRSLRAALPCRPSLAVARCQRDRRRPAAGPPARTRRPWPWVLAVRQSRPKALARGQQG